MKARLIALPLLVLAVVSCDKAKKLAHQASSAVQDKIAKKSTESDSKPEDPELRKLVDQTAEGVVFRKDLPFPKRLEVHVTRHSEMSGRFYQSSAIEKRSENVNGTQTHVYKLERSATQVRYTLEQSGFSIPTPDDPDADKKTIADPLAQAALSNKPITFRKTGDSWQSDDRDGFRASVLSKQLSPVFEQLLIDNALAPRPLWFGKRRMKVGDQIVATGDTLPMLLAGNAKGSFTLKLEAFESVAGHPCGAFSVTGDYTRKQFPDFDGNITDADVTIQSGKMWLSLIHPMILREELDTIQTFKSGGQGGLVGRGQGSVKVSIKREWKILPP